MCNRIPAWVPALCGSVAALFVFLGTVALSGHAHPGLDSAYLNAVLRNDGLISGWITALLIAAAGYGQAKGSPMPPLEVMPVGLLWHFTPALSAHWPLVATGSNIVVLVGLAYLLVRFGGAVCVMASFLIVGVVMTPVWVVPAGRKAAKRRLGTAAPFVEFSVLTVASVVGMPLIPLFCLLLVFPVTRTWIDRLIDRLSGINPLDLRPEPNDTPLPEEEGSCVQS